jgi:hypothetical protein
MRNIDSTFESGTHKRFVTRGTLDSKIANHQPIVEFFSNLLKLFERVYAPPTMHSQFHRSRCLAPDLNSIASTSPSSTILIPRPCRRPQSRVTPSSNQTGTKSTLQGDNGLRRNPI